MQYFRHLQTTDYDGILLTNILCRGKIREMVQNNSAVYYEYVIQDGDRPDTLAHKYYGSSNYAWLIFYANDINDPVFDWPLEYNQFLEFLDARYKYDTTLPVQQYLQQTVHHYVDSDGFEVDALTITKNSLTATPVTYYEYENELNEAKRNIKIIDARFVGQITNELRQLFK